MLEEYKSLLEAGKLIREAMLELNREEGMFVSPAFRKLSHAEKWISSQMESLLADS
jgi:hypothetical protein